MKTTTFTSQQLFKALDINNREQVYWVDRGYIVPDIQSERPRIYSARQALYAGLTRHFQNRGYTLERSNRIAKMAGGTAIAFLTMLNNDRLYHEPEITLTIHDGVFCSLDTRLYSQDKNISGAFLGIFVSDISISPDEALFFKTGEWDEVCNTNLTRVVGNILQKLGTGFEALQGLPDDLEMVIGSPSKEDYQGEHVSVFRISMRTDP